MRTVILFGLAASLVASVAMAEPLKLNDEQMASTTAGVLSMGDFNVGVGIDLTNVTNVPSNVGVVASNALAINVLSSEAATAMIMDMLPQTNIVNP